MTNDDIITGILAREGGPKFTMDPADPGGATKYGITQRTLSDYLGRGVSYLEVETLTEEVARKIYFEKYLSKFLYIEVSSIRELLTDCAVNHGVNQAVKWLQKALKIEADGIMGKETKEALDYFQHDDYYEHRSQEVFNNICASRIEFYVDLVLRKPILIKYLRGWINRATSFLEK